MHNLAIIPARGGSKRIPRKNIKDFLGKPIIAYSIEVALQCGLFDEVMVSTDDQEIAEISRKHGASVPFFRSKKNSSDFASTSDVLLEVINEYEKQGTFFTNVCCIYPTAPLISKSKLLDGFNLLNEKHFDSVFPVVQFSYPILRSLKFENDHILMNWPEHLNTRSQDLTPAYHDAGQFYWVNIKSFTEKMAIFTDNAGAIKLTETEVQDIDNETDWTLAELKYKLITQLRNEN